MLKFLKKKQQVKINVAIECVAPYWVVLIQNSGQKNWSALRSATKTVSVPNEFNEVVKRYPAIETFPSKREAALWVDSHLHDADIISRKDSEIEKFLLKAHAPVGAVDHA